MKSKDLNSIAIIAEWWIKNQIINRDINEKYFQKEIAAAKELRKITSKLDGNEEITIIAKSTKQP